ncbi:MAG: hypothetical protein V2B15_11925 [Bacteroidota bacterium]
MKTTFKDRMKHFFIFLLITPSLLSPFELSAQDHQVQARILDASKMLPVSFVKVNNHDGEEIIADESGFFRYHFSENEGEDSLDLSCIGYHPYTLVLSDLHQDRLDTIFLFQNFETKSSKVPKAKKIIKQAVTAVPENHPGHPVKYNGYYREYVRRGNTTINLLESIIDLSDPGMQSEDDFSAGILYKRINPAFTIDESVLNSGDNELVLLRSFDPVRNFDLPANSYIDYLSSNFAKNHLFDASRVTFMDGRSYYVISFVDNKSPGKNDIDLVSEGVIYIDTRDFGIKRLDYNGFAWRGINRKKIFGLSLEYTLHQDEYYLNYLSFNNLFMIADTTDSEGNPLEKTRYREYNQYREFFVRDFETEETIISRNLMDKLKPVSENMVFGDPYPDTLWLNTPLLSEEDHRGDIRIENLSFQTGIENLLQRNEKTINEVVYLHTDREVYAPADTLWFKAYIRDLGVLSGTERSRTLFVKLLNDQGDMMDGGRFIIENADATGQFVLSHKLKEGVYYLNAYSSWMQNYAPDQLYTKKILVRNERRKGPQMVVNFDRSSYYKGDTIKANIHCYDALNRDVENVFFTCNVLAGKETVVRSRTRTSLQNNDTIKFILPDQFTGAAMIRITGNHKGEPLDTAYRIPAIHAVHVDFFPEGGNIINGLESRIAFKAQNLLGEPVHIAGHIIDRDGTLITAIEAEHDGMGSFFLTADKDQKMFLRLTEPPGIDSLYPLPGGVEQGWQLSGTSGRNSISLLIKRKETTGDIALITVMVRGYLCYYQQIRVDQSASILIPTADLPQGIAVLTLFDDRMRPRAERLFYVNPGGEIGIRMETDRGTYIPRDKVILDIHPASGQFKDLKGSFSLSVVDDQLCNTDFIQEPNLRSSFLLSPEIKGSIHNPNHYLENEPGIQNHLDLLLLTQGWRNYSYIDEVDWKNQVEPPGDMEVVSGTLLRQPFGKDPLPSSGKVNVFYGGTSVKIPVSNNGRFQFTPEYDMKYNSGVLVTGETNGTGQPILHMDSTSFLKNYHSSRFALIDSLTKSSYIPVIPYRSISDQFSLGLTYYEWIEEVEIVKARTRPEEELNSSIEDFIIQNKREAKPVSIAEAGSLIDIFFNMGVPVEEVIEGDSHTLIHMMYPRSVIGWVVDGFYYGTDFREVSYISPPQIDKFFIIKHTETKYFGSRTPEVVVSIRLKKFKPGEQVPGVYLSKFNIPKFEVAKEFYKPLYDTDETRKSTLPDLRKTIYWDPDIKIGPDGKVRVEFYNGDRYTNIKCILEGITDEGVPVYSEFSYDVSLSRN